MPKNTSITLGEHFEGFIADQISRGRYGSASELIREGLRLVEEREQKYEALRQALIVGENSGDAGEFDIEKIKRKGREKARSAGLDV
ncbi:MAG: type II toxin-antitoxin system ParD family antitoxin [Gammaproteobacteria bacterium]|nr:type II toxin-antitoxin system ParD family antitoxin [Gammaproteobacteria bacterium]